MSRCLRQVRTPHPTLPCPRHLGMVTRPLFDQEGQAQPQAGGPWMTCLVVIPVSSAHTLPRAQLAGTARPGTGAHCLDHTGC